MSKRNLKQVFVLLLAVAILPILVLAGCSSQPTDSKAPPSGQADSTGSSSGNAAPAKTELVYSSWMSITVIDPQKGNATAQSAERPVFSALLDTKPGTHELLPDLAEKYEVSADGKTYTFHLRKGVKFHKGFGELKASDVVFTFNRIRDPKTPSRYSVNYKSVESITAPDDYTVVFKLKTPDVAFPYLLSGAFQGAYIYSEKAVAQYGDTIGQNPIGSGPYQLEELIPQNKVVYTANPDYYNGAPQIKKLTYLQIPNDNTSFMAFQKGEIDAMVTQTPEILEQAKAQKDVTIQQIPQFSDSLLFMNTKVKPFDDIRVRQAMAYAIDKDEIVNTVFGAINSPAKGYVPSIAQGFTTEGVTQYQYNPDKAKELLTQAGYANGFTITTKQNNSPSTQRVFTVLQAQLAKVGIKLDFQAVQLPEWQKFQQSGTAQFGWWSGVAPTDIQYFMKTYYYGASTPPGNNAAYYTGIDDILNKAMQESDANERADLYKQAQQKLSQDVPYIPLYESKCNLITKKNLEGLVPGGDFSTDVRFGDAHFVN